MFGYACTETPGTDAGADLITRSKILRVDGRGASLPARRPIFGPDAKSQVTLQYVNGKPVKATSVVVSTQHAEIDRARKRCARSCARYVLKILPQGWMCDEEHFYVNPTGRFVIGGPDGDAGLTGRKIIVDTYGGAAPHGGGAFSGKDPSKVDRSAAYAARYLAKNVVAAGLAERCTIQLSYAIGVSKPLSVYINTDGTGKVDEEKLVKRAAGDGRSQPARHPHASQAQPADLCAHRCLWPFRPQARCRWRLLVGEDRSRRRAEARFLIRVAHGRRLQGRRHQARRLGPQGDLTSPRPRCPA